MVTAWVHWIVTVLQNNFDCKKKEDKSLLDVENVETAVERCCNLTRRTPLNCSLCMFIGMKHISPKFSYIIPIYLMLTPFTKTLPKCHFTYFFAINIVSISEEQFEFVKGKSTTDAIFELR